jgi:hypothetical protein
VSPPAEGGSVQAAEPHSRSSSIFGRSAIRVPPVATALGRSRWADNQYRGRADSFASTASGESVASSYMAHTAPQLSPRVGPLVPCEFSDIRDRMMRLSLARTTPAAETQGLSSTLSPIASDGEEPEQEAATVAASSTPVPAPVTRSLAQSRHAAPATRSLTQSRHAPPNPAIRSLAQSRHAAPTASNTQASAHQGRSGGSRAVQGQWRR